MTIADPPKLRGVGAALARLLRVPPEPAPPAGSAGSLRVFRASPSWVRYRMVGWLIGHSVSFVLLGGLSLAIAAAGVLSGRDVAPWLAVTALVVASVPLLFWLFLAGLSALTLRIDRDLRWYMVTDRSLRIREGIWFVREMTMSFANIQNVSVSQGPLQRMFGLADVVVQTAGGGGGGAPEGAQGAALHIGHFRGLADADEVRDFIVQRMRAASGDSLQDATATAAPAQGEVVQALREVAAEAAALRIAGSIQTWPILDNSET